MTQPALSLIPSDNHAGLLRMLYLIREVEEEIARRYPEGKMRCPTHLSIGQEGVPAVMSVLLNQQDLAVSTHRSHAHYLAKGGDLTAMLAEIYGRVGGCSGGRGGSMHLIDERVGFKGSTAIVGNTIPIGVGLGLALKMQQAESQVAVVYLGDGAIEEGAFYEAANFAVVQKLPVLFVCENNLYSVYSSLQVRQPQDRKIAELAAALGLKSAAGDGNDLPGCYATIAPLLAQVRAGQGPALVELATYRWREHCGPHYDNDLGYRSENEFLQWRARDPLSLFEQRLQQEGQWRMEDCLKLRVEVQLQVQQAFADAESQPYPASTEAYTQVYRENLNG
ncbi:thiamine pyrophosphate-dependent dehydrogenase E1 component subunit alpha [Balneatrix alpica]|uniref:Thiamine pyrophosphate-dependent dehydrogenase E1 component subunit alpha n=1 Tax=Balneatrix alpica TaxID=75684 RepID=A0ABV5ZEA9_9GAMM|nr:thiamine pyrophosphate-dependent dehydrogenase E1 component subunit alpha [Balneatrix alpica]